MGSTMTPICPCIIEEVGTGGNRKEPEGIDFIGDDTSGPTPARSRYKQKSTSSAMPIDILKAARRLQEQGTFNEEQAQRTVGPS